MFGFIYVFSKFRIEKMMLGNEFMERLLDRKSKKEIIHESIDSKVCFILKKEEVLRGSLRDDLLDYHNV